ncbi:MAG: M28 family peptidase [Gloeocapsa sp. DLM2.Bin57]|nr:MAG: M28 family peptidase [Gloeocapsa sp. DLM2.Bin57]
MPSEILDYLCNLAIPRHPLLNPLGYMTVKRYILEQFSLLGQPEEFHFTEPATPPGCNIILKFPGQNPQLPPLLIGAHYDGVPNTAAADDNASAVAALLILAKYLHQKQLNRSIWLVAFDMEEWGMCGSLALAKHFYQQKQSLQLMISLEMLGYTSPTQDYPVAGMEQIYGTRGDFIALVANQELAPTAKIMENIFNQFVRCQVLCVPNKGNGITGIRLSDHSPFWDYNYDAMMITDTAFMRNPHYHQPTDTIDTLDLNFLA